MNIATGLLKILILQLVLVSCFEAEKVGPKNFGAETSSSKFISTWRTSTPNETITLPLRAGYSYNITVDWGDGSKSTINSASSSEKTHTYTTAGDYQIKITGRAEAWHQNNSGDRAKLISVEEFGDLGWTNLKGAFHGASNLESFRVSGSISNLINTASMFEGASSVTSLNICGLDTSRVFDMSNMFKDVSSLTTLDSTCLDTKDAINLSGLFYNMSSITSLNISEFDLSKVENMDNAFRGIGVVSLEVGPIEDKQTPNLISLASVFTSTTATLNCSANGITGFGSFLGQTCSGETDDFFVSRWSLTNGNTVTLPLITGYNYDFYIDWGDGTVSEITSHDDPDKTHTYSLGGPQTVTMKITGTCEAWNYITAGAGKNFLIHIDNLGDVGWINLEGAFSGANLITAKINNTDSVTNMRHLLSSNFNLTTIDLSETDTANVTDMGYMFTETRPNALNMSNFDTLNVTQMDSMFRRVTSYIPLDLSSFNTSNVTDMSYMFSDFRGNLTALDLSNFNTSNVTNMSGMFENWGTSFDSLGTINLSSFDTSNVTDMSNMFRGRYNMSSLDVSSFNTSNVTNMSEMFSSLSNFSLTSLDLSNFDTSNVTNMSRMFNNSLYITSLDLSNFNTSNVTNMSEMFAYARRLNNLNTNNWNIGAVTNSTNVFLVTGTVGGPLVLFCDQVGGSMFGQTCN